MHFPELLAGPRGGGEAPRPLPLGLRLSLAPGGGRWLSGTRRPGEAVAGEASSKGAGWHRARMCFWGAWASPQTHLPFPAPWHWPHRCPTSHSRTEDRGPERSRPSAVLPETGSRGTTRPGPGLCRAGRPFSQGCPGAGGRRRAGFTTHPLPPAAGQAASRKVAAI